MTKIFFVFHLIQIDIETLQELLIFVLRRDNLDFIAQLRTQNLEGCLVQRFRGGSHLAELEQDGDEVPGEPGTRSSSQSCRPDRSSMRPGANE